MFYVYLLRSLSHPDQRYVGFTNDLKRGAARYPRTSSPPRRSGDGSQAECGFLRLLAAAPPSLWARRFTRRIPLLRARYRHHDPKTDHDERADADPGMRDMEQKRPIDKTAQQDDETGNVKDKS